eukprot:scpid66709/ scgid3903/ Metalloendopeptidase OMA1, mitochondrial; Overlapping with the m-AAA protease 1 homolog
MFRLKLHNVCRPVVFTATRSHAGIALSRPRPAAVRTLCRKPPVASRPHRRSFQTSGRRAAPIPLGLLAAVSLRAPAIIATRVIRRYLWPWLKPETRAILSRQLVIAGLLSYVGLAGYAASHTDIVNGRRRVLWLTESEKLFLDTAAREGILQSIQEDANAVILPNNHRLYKKVSRVMVQLVKANPCAQQVDWELAVVDSPVKNAVSFPGGTVVVYTGILDVTKDRNDLAVLLGHEMAHTVLRHQEEAVSQRKLLNMIILPVTIAVNAFTGVGFSSFIYFGEKWFSKVFVSMPYSRMREKEADDLGMEMAARACFDMRNAPEFFSRISEIPEDMEWLSTHPTGEHRRQALTDRLTEMMEITREECAGYSKWFNRTVLRQSTGVGMKNQSHLPGSGKQQSSAEQPTTSPTTSSTTSSSPPPSAQTTSTPVDLVKTTPGHSGQEAPPTQAPATLPAPAQAHTQKPAQRSQQQQPATVHPGNAPSVRSMSASSLTAIPPSTKIMVKTTTASSTPSSP